MDENSNGAKAGAIAERPAPQRKYPEPQCPRCHHHPVQIVAMDQKFTSGAIVRVFYCADCGIVLPAQLIAVSQPAVVPASAMPGKVSLT